MDLVGNCVGYGSDGDSDERGNDVEGEKLVKTAISNRRSIKRAMKSLPLPSTFWKLYVTCFTLYMASVAIAFTEHILFTQLFQNLKKQVESFSSQSDEYRTFYEADSIILQMVSTNE